jgi:hypothetical protein
VASGSSPMPAWAAHTLLAGPAAPSRCRGSAAQRPLHDRVRCSGCQLLDRALDRLTDPQVCPQRPPVLHHRDLGRPLHITADSLPALRQVLEAINGASLRTSVAELGIWSRTAATLGNRHPSASVRTLPPIWRRSLPASMVDSGAQIWVICGAARALGRLNRHRAVAAPYVMRAVFLPG